MDHDEARRRFAGGIFQNETVTLGPSQWTGNCVFMDCILECHDPEHPPLMYGAFMQGCTFMCQGQDMGPLWERLPVKQRARAERERQIAEELVLNNDE